MKVMSKFKCKSRILITIEQIVHVKLTPILVLQMHCAPVCIVISVTAGGGVYCVCIVDKSLLLYSLEVVVVGEERMGSMRVRSGGESSWTYSN